MFALPSSFSHFPWAKVVRCVMIKGALLSVKSCSASEIITADTLTTVLTHSCWFSVSKLFIFPLPCLQVSTVQSCVRIAWRAAAATPKILTIWRTGTALVEAWSTNNTLLPRPTLTFTQGNSMMRGHTRPRCATGHPTESERTFKDFQKTTIRYNRTNTIEKVRLEFKYEPSGSAINLKS